MHDVHLFKGLLVSELTRYILSSRLARGRAAKRLGERSTLFRKRSKARKCFMCVSREGACAAPGGTCTSRHGPRILGSKVHR